MKTQTIYKGPREFEIRTGEPEEQAGRIYPINPAAHAKLREAWGVPPGGRRLIERDKQIHAKSKSWGDTGKPAKPRKKRKGGPRIVLSTAQLEEASRRHDAGESLRALAADFEVSVRTLHTRLREADYDTSRRRGER